MPAKNFSRRTLFSAVFVATAYFVIAVDTSSAQVYNKEKIYRYLKAQQNPQTGLVNSFTDTADEMLLYQASTYDQSLAAMTFLLNNDFEAAASILNFFHAKWTGIGFANFYHTKTGDVGLETTTHLGPNAWIAIAALQYDVITGRRRFYELACKIALWIAQLPQDSAGGLAMGPWADWGANWREVFSSENNISAFGVFSGIQPVTFDSDQKAVFDRKAAGIKAFLKQKIFARKPRIPVGPDNTVMASDVFAFALLAFSPGDFESVLGVSAQEMFMILEENFFVDTDDIVGYDFTDKVSRQSFQRQPMISIEWSAMIALAYLRVGSYFAQLADLMNDQAVSQEAVTMSNKAAVIVQNLDQKAIMRGHQQMVYPYATKAWEQVFPFAPWWRTPQRGERGRLAGSLSGTCWRVFIEEQFNPFQFTRSR